MTGWVIPVDGRAALNLDHVARFEIRDERTPNGLAGRAVFAVFENAVVCRVSNVTEQGAKDSSRPRVGWFDGRAGMVLDLLVSALGDVAAGDRHLIRIDDLEALSAPR